MKAVHAGAVSVLLVAGALVACAPMTPDPASAPSASPSSPPTATASAPPTSNVLTVSIPRDENLVGELPAMRGSAQAGPFDNPTGRVALYIRCVGEGDVVVEIIGAAAVTQACQGDPDDPGSRNMLDVGANEDIVITGSAESTALWTVAVTSIPNS
ncbi:hypothetical protein [Microbacterium sp. LBN7]|uniref:hypothetical protein n=1 Tax=Microbacterium sp. LBN7 TaxID=3129773 RepID=UPI003244E3D0